MPIDPSRAQRAVLESRGGELYREIVAAGSLASSDPRLQAGHPDRAALDVLIDLGLLVLDAEEGAYLPLEPTSAQARVVAPLGRQAVQLLRESTAWIEAFAGLGQAFRRVTPTEGPIVHLRGAEAVGRYLTAIVHEATTDVLSAHPSGPGAELLASEAGGREVLALHRGVSVRTMYQHSARRNPATRAHVDQLVASGGQVRTLNEVFNPFVAVDRRVVVLPDPTTEASALAVHEPGLVAHLVGGFDQCWERAGDFNERAGLPARPVTDDVHQLTLRMLVEGHSDHASAKRLGVSTRTYAGYVATLKDNYRVQTRFQLGYALGRGQSGPQRVAPGAASEG